MNIGLAEEQTGTLAPAQSRQGGGLTEAIKSFFGRCSQPARSDAWSSGYNAFYEGVQENPHAPGSDAHAQWELGSKAFKSDFEW
jgi:hypothetical protein